MSMYTDDEPRPLMETFFKDKHVHSPRVGHHGDLIDRCAGTCKGNSLASYYLNRNRREKLVVYVRVSYENDVDEKVELIREYCLDNNFQIADIFTDIGDHPSFGFKAALDAMENADGLISVDLNQFVSSGGDRVRELRPLIHHFFCAGGKHLITIADGIDTGTHFGQQNAIELMADTRAGFGT